MQIDLEKHYKGFLAHQYSEFAEQIRAAVSQGSPIRINGMSRMNIGEIVSDLDVLTVADLIQWPVPPADYTAPKTVRVVHECKHHRWTGPSKKTLAKRAAKRARHQK